MAAISDLPKMKLWYYPMYRSTRCMWLIKELGIESSVEYKFVDIPFPPPPEPLPERVEYQRKVHPHSTVPALEIEGQKPILESGAIVLYLADLAGKLAPEPAKRAEYYNWIMYSCVTMDEVMERLITQWCLLPEDKRDKALEAKAKEGTDRCLDIVEKALEGKNYILGNELTAADCALGYNVLWAALPEMHDGELLKGRPNLQAYLDRINARPALQETKNHK